MSSDDAGSFFDGYRDTDEKVWRLLSQFGIDERGVTFNYSPYDVLPFVFGFHEVLVPWGFLYSRIGSQFESLPDELQQPSRYRHEY